MDEREAGHWLKLKDFETVGVLMELSQARHTGYAFLFLCFTPGEVDDAPVKAARLHLHTLVPWCIMPEYVLHALVHASWLQSPPSIFLPASTCNLSSSAAAPFNLLL